MERADLFDEIALQLRRLPGRVRIGLCVGIPAVALALAFSSAQRPGYAAAVVGEMHVGQTTSRPPRTLEAIKAEYRRPDTIPFPKENPYTPRKAGLGKRLYFDARLSGSNALSCASCHNPALGWGAGLPKGIGHGMRQLARPSPPITNPACAHIFCWAGQAP